MPNHRECEPGNGALFDEVGIGGAAIRNGLGPDPARILRALPCSANRAFIVWIWINAEEVGNDLVVAVEQCGLRGEE